MTPNLIQKAINRITVNIKATFQFFTGILLIMLLPVLSFAQQDVKVYWMSDTFTKLKIEGARMGVNVSFTRNPNEVQTHGIFVLGSDLAALNQTYALANNGYRTVLLIPVAAQAISEDLLTLFGVGIAAEQVVPRANNLVIDGAEWADIFGGFKLGQSGRTSVISYLEPISGTARCAGTGFVSKSTNQQRCLAAEVTFGEGKALLMIVPREYTGRGSNMRWVSRNTAPIMDQTIEQLDNKQAAIQILRWIMN